jgi:FMN phosphatase YigB (HAD superfamily)
VKAVLFDLDGTLLGNEIDVFMPQYFRLLSHAFAPYYPPDKFGSALMEATGAMMQPHPGRLNKEVFWQVFLARTGLDYDEIHPLTERFYRDIFPGLAPLTTPVAGATELLDALFAKGYTVAVATNPLFPREAIVERLRWGGVDRYPFALITSYENMHATKPYAEYWLEILEQIRCPPEATLMVGNSLSDDMAAKDSGLFTYYVTDQALTAADSERVDWAGPLAGVRSILNE